MLLMHGLYKLINGFDGITAVVTVNNWPHWIAYGVLIGEILAPALILIGIMTRIAAVVIVINMAVAVYLAHAHQLLQLSKTGGWMLELQGMFFFCALAIALLGAGKYSLGGTRGRLN
jgi:putative oxidoreductase